MKSRKRILVAPLDWGLGHATRCVPLIDALVQQGCEVVVASAGAALEVLRRRYPGFAFHELPAYNVRYSATARMTLAMLRQLPRLQRVIEAEHAVVNALVEREPFDGIVSDNRYGVFSNRVPSVLVTHQLQVMMPPSLRVFQPWVKKSLHRYINRFDACWVPDSSETDNLSGDLSHNANVRIPLSFIGPLSRFANGSGEVKESAPFTYDFLLLLSGPEPQRTILEEKLVAQLLPTGYRVMLVRGVLHLSYAKPLRDNFNVIQFADGEMLARLVNTSSCVVARSGYSSVMDLCALNANALFIPTPGQTEQQYLAKTMSEKSWCVTAEQRSIDVANAVRQMDGVTGFPKTLNFNLHQAVVRDWLQTI